MRRKPPSAAAAMLRGEKAAQAVLTAYWQVVDAQPKSRRRYRTPLEHTICAANGCGCKRKKDRGYVGIHARNEECHQ